MLPYVEVPFWNLQIWGNLAKVPLLPSKPRPRAPRVWCQWTHIPLLVYLSRSDSIQIASRGIQKTHDYSIVKACKKWCCIPQIFLFPLKEGLVSVYIIQYPREGRIYKLRRKFTHSKKCYKFCKIISYHVVRLQSRVIPQKTGIMSAFR